MPCWHTATCCTCSVARRDDFDRARLIAPGPQGISRNPVIVRVLPSAVVTLRRST